MKGKKLTKPSISENQIHCSATRGSASFLPPSDDDAEGTGEGGPLLLSSPSTSPPSLVLLLPASEAEELFPLFLLLIVFFFWCSIIRIAPSNTLVMWAVLLLTSREPRARERTE